MKLPRGRHFACGSAAVAAGCALALWTGAAFADGPIGPNGTRIQTSSYRVDLTQTPVLAGSRVLGLGGSYVAIAEGTDGDAQNPAAPAVRYPYSVDWFDYDLGLGVTTLSPSDGNDFFNTGQPRAAGADESEFVFVDVGLNLQFGPWGVGGGADIQAYELQALTSTTVDRLDVTVITTRLQLARAFLDHQLAAGIGLRHVLFDISRPYPTPGERSRLFTLTSSGIELGLLWKPNEQPYRLGFSARPRVLVRSNKKKQAVTADARGDVVVGDPTSPDAIFLPRTTIVPWEVHVGTAVQLGPRPLNPRWTDPGPIEDAIEKRFEERERARRTRRADLLARRGMGEKSSPEAMLAVDGELERERFLDEQEEQRLKDELRDRLRAEYEAMERFYVLLTASVLMTGRVEDGVGTEAFLRQEVDRSGQQLTFSPRIGLETEPVPRWIKLRVGSYYEPTRFDNGLAHARAHGTAGLELKVLPWTVFGLYDDPTWWRVGAVLDFADRYFSFGLTLGVWH